MNHPGVSRRGQEFEESAFWLLGDVVETGAKGGEEFGEVGGVDEDGYFEEEAGHFWIGFRIFRLEGERG